MDRALENETFVGAVNWTEVLSKLAELGRDLGSATRALTEAGVLGQSLIIRPLDEAQAREIARLSRSPALRASRLGIGLVWRLPLAWIYRRSRRIVRGGS